jgi:hypothetical protein
VNIHERVLRAMSVPGQNHRDPWFAAWWKEILEDSKMIYNTTEGTPFIFSGTGTGGWESALTNTLSPGDKVLTFRYGQFSHLWVDMMQRLGLDVEVHDRPWGEGACEKTVEQVLSKDKAHKIKAVCVVHNETTTGVTSDIAGVRAAMDAAGHPALLMVDGVSSIGALDFQFDKVGAAWGGGRPGGGGGGRPGVWRGGGGGCRGGVDWGRLVWGSESRAAGVPQSLKLPDVIARGRALTPPPRPALARPSLPSPSGASTWR